MTEAEEKLWLLGYRSAWLAVLSEALGHLGYDSEACSKVGWVTERENAIAVLRRVCAEHGDNDWDEKLVLADVIDKHLGRHLG